MEVKPFTGRTPRHRPGFGRQSQKMRVAIIDVGSNTVRLLVAERTALGLLPLQEEKAQISLGAEVVRAGRISDGKLLEVGRHARAFAAVASGLGCERIETLVTAPGRQSDNAGALLLVLGAAVGQAARVVSAEEEGRLAYIGARAATPLPGVVAVVDIGGGSTELMGGGDPTRPDWLLSLDIGSQVLTARHFDDQLPRKRAIAACREEIAAAFAGVTTPEMSAALVAGGTGRMLRRVMGARIVSAEDIECAVCRLSKRTPREASADYRLDEGRGRVALAGALLAVEAQRVLGVPLEVACGGIREGAVLEVCSGVAAA